MNSRERVKAALEHRQPDRPPIDLGSTSVTGAQASVVSKVRQALGLDKPGARVKVVEPFQMLGEVGDDLKKALGVDTMGVGLNGTFFGFPQVEWKPWITFDDTPVLVPGGFNTVPDENGDILQWPCDDRTCRPSARMPKGGFYFDAITRQEPIDDAKLNVADNTDEFTLITDEQLSELRTNVERAYRETDYALVGGFASTSFGDVALVQAPFIKRPKGIRDVAEWYMSTVMRRDYIYEVFDRQCAIGIENLKLAHQAVGEKIAVAISSTTDFGTQNAPFLSPDAYRDLFQPFHKRVNDWIHANTTWKTFMHSCGSIDPLLPHFIDAGFDIVNPVQTSAVGMDPKMLKSKYGDKVTFWGGLVDTQRTLPFGTIDEVRAQVKERLRIFNQGGGFVACSVHNIQTGCPAESVIEMFRLAREWK